MSRRFKRMLPDAASIVPGTPPYTIPALFPLLLKKSRVWRLLELFWMRLVRVLAMSKKPMKLPVRRKEAAPLSKRIWSTEKPGEKSLFDIVRVLPAKCRKSLDVGGIVGPDQFADVDQLLSVPPPVQTSSLWVARSGAVKKIG